MNTGTQVIHQGFGYGTVIAKNGNIVKVNFGTSIVDVQVSELKQSINS